MKSTPSAEPAFGLSRDRWGRLVLIDAEGQRHVGVFPVRSFPISDPNHWINLCTAEGRELVCVEDPAKLPTQVRDLLAEELRQRDFIPEIERILTCRTEKGIDTWRVATDRGETTIEIANEDQVRRLNSGGVLIECQGIRYLIRDVRQLDAAGRRTLDRYL